MGRYEKLRELFREKRCFKLVCGAGNEDVEEVRRLSTIYTIAGTNVLDLSANVDVVNAAKRGIEIAYEKAPFLGKDIKIRPYLNVSIGLKGDPHIRKAIIDLKLCTECGKCIKACGEREAIKDDFIVIDSRCIGCGDCEKSCSFGAIEYYYKKADFEKILPECIAAGTETMELHAISLDDEGVRNDWKLLNKLIPGNYVSMCLDRTLLSNNHLIERVREAYSITGKRMIVQADGDPMSGSEDDFNTTLQTIACADIVIKSEIPVMIYLSGGTNSKTGLLAKQCGVEAHGVAIGSYARKIVRKYITNEEFDNNMDILKEAVMVAEQLIKPNIEAISG
ncbi:MAG: 4Fe-4S binding protein [Candidatus Scalindua sp.]|jgi:ferredoxin|nr:4Fe-4S binding protein [Candidatus Scalindua sp.]